MSELLSLIAIAGTGVVVYQALTAETGHEKIAAQPHVRMEHSDDKEFTTRGMFQLRDVPATVIRRSGSFVTVNVLGQNHTITQDRLKMLMDRNHLIVRSAEKETEQLSSTAKKGILKMDIAAQANAYRRRPDVKISKLNSRVSRPESDAWRM